MQSSKQEALVSLHNLVEGDGQVADALADGGAGDADLADAAGAHGGVWVGDVGPEDVDF